MACAEQLVFEEGNNEMPAASLGEGQTAADGVTRLDLLPARPGNPRNSEGDFVELNDGRILFVYTRFRGGAGDHAAADLMARISPDRGLSWSDEDELVVANHAGLNVMSVSLLRLADGRIALFYMRKDAVADCRPVVRFSADEAASWGDPIDMVADVDAGYYVMNNSRVIQLDDGRLIAPVAHHRGPADLETPGVWQEKGSYGRILCYRSDDGGQTWHRGAVAPEAPRRDGGPVKLQEPGVEALRDGRLLLWCRTDDRCQYVAHSSDGGQRFDRLRPSAIVSPHRSPAAIRRIPSTGDLLLVWNDHTGVPEEHASRRSPLNTAISRDEGQTWQHRRVLEDDPQGWYCYTAVRFVDDQVLLSYCAANGLQETRLTRLPVSWLYG